jgi:ArsR family transcriptional regulator
MTTVKDQLLQLHASVCKGLADPKRLLIINALRHEERSVGELCETLHLPQANVSQHLAVLRDKGLVVSRRDGQRVYYRVSSPKINEALDLLLEVMADQLGTVPQPARS